MATQRIVTRKLSLTRPCRALRPGTIDRAAMVPDCQHFKPKLFAPATMRPAGTFSSSGAASGNHCLSISSTAATGSEFGSLGPVTAREPLYQRWREGRESGEAADVDVGRPPPTSAPRQALCHRRHQLLVVELRAVLPATLIATSATDEPQLVLVIACVLTAKFIDHRNQ